MLKWMIALVSLGLSLNASALTLSCNPQEGGPCLVGAFKGMIQQGKETAYVDLMMRPIAGRVGSYLGILFQNAPGGFFKDEKYYRAEIYLIDPLRSNTYEMTPMNVTPDGSIGVINADPSLVMSFHGFKRGRPKLTIVSANSSNQAGFQNAIEFTGEYRSKFSWSPFRGGDYQAYDANHDDPTVLRLSEKDAEFQANAVITLENPLNGSFLLEERKPGLFAIKAISVRATGAHAETYPRKIAFFFTYGRSTRLALITPHEGSNLIVLKGK